MTITVLELAGAVLDWDSAPGNHGGNPYCRYFVALAQQAVSEAASAAASTTLTATEKRLAQVDADASQRREHGEAIARRKVANIPWPDLGFDPAEATHAKCANCVKVYEIDDLDEYHDFWSQISVGSEHPAGDCPECGAFCYAVKMPTKAEAARFDVV